MSKHIIEIKAFVLNDKRHDAGWYMAARIVIKSGDTLWVRI